MDQLSMSHTCTYVRPVVFVKFFRCAQNLQELSLSPAVKKHFFNVGSTLSATSCTDQASTMEASERERDETVNPGGGAGSARQTVTTESNNNVLFALRKVREEFNRRCDVMEAMQKEQMQTMKDVVQMVGDVSTKIERHGSMVTDTVVGEVRSALGTVLDSPRQALGRSDSSARKKSYTRTHPHLGLIVEKERGTVPFLQWLSLVSVVSFVRQQPNARAWISEATFAKLGDGLAALSRASGLSVVLFSVAASDKNDRYHTDTGRAWSFLIRNVIISILWYAKQKLFTKQAPQVEVTPDAEISRHLTGQQDTCVLRIAMPAWLQAMGRKKKIVRIVYDVENLIEAVRADASSTTAAGEETAAPVRKKRKKVQEDIDEEAENCSSVVRQLRSKLTRTMSNGRTEARVQLYKNALFIMEKIRQYPSVEEAKASGYEVVFHPAADPVEEFIPSPENLRNSIWDIPNTRTVDIQERGRELSTAEKTTIHEWNASLLSALQAKFPSLTVTFKYKKNVIRTPAMQRTAIPSSSSRISCGRWRRLSAFIRQH